MRTSIIAIALLTLTGCQAEDAAQFTASASCGFDEMALDGASIAEAASIKHVMYSAADGTHTSLALYEDGTARWLMAEDQVLVRSLAVGEWTLTEDCTVEMVVDGEIEIVLSNPVIDEDGALTHVDIDEPVRGKSGSAIEVWTDHTPTTF
jgi:hypothetical protein